MKGAARYTVPAVVVGAGLNGLGVIRSLATAGVPITVLDNDKWQPGMHCRYGTKVVYHDNVVDGLIRLGQRHVTEGVRPVLFLTQERVVSEVSMQRESLAPFFHISLPAPSVLDQLQRKDAFHRIAESIGSTVPRTVHVTDRSELGRVHTLMAPLIVKPSYHDLAYERTFRKAYKVRSTGEAEALVQRILHVLPDVVIQEWIDGDDSDIFFCLQYLRYPDGPVASFVGRKIRSWPPVVGGTASCTQARDRLDLIEPTTRFFRHAGVIGLAGMEYKRDRRTGRFVMVEPTIGRTDYQEEVATLNGTNIPLSGYCSELDLPLPDSGYTRRSYIWRDRAADRKSASEINAAFHAPLSSSRVVDALWRISDPLPSVTQVARRIWLRTGRLVSRAIRISKNSMGVR